MGSTKTLALLLLGLLDEPVERDHAGSLRLKRCENLERARLGTSGRVSSSAVPVPAAAPFSALGGLAAGLMEDNPAITLVGVRASLDFRRNRKGE